jgi:hypothetical protein
MAAITVGSMSSMLGTDAYNALMQARGSAAALNRERYFRIPTQIWTHGYIADLTGPGTAMLLALLSKQRADFDKGIWLSPSRAAERFAYSSSTRRRGLDELRQLGLVTMRTQTVSERGNYIEFARRRNVTPSPSSRRRPRGRHGLVPLEQRPILHRDHPTNLSGWPRFPASLRPRFQASSTTTSTMRWRFAPNMLRGQHRLRDPSWRRMHRRLTCRRHRHRHPGDGRPSTVR